jgi:hypothetical protein
MIKMSFTPYIQKWGPDYIPKKKKKKKKKKENASYGHLIDRFARPIRILFFPMPWSIDGGQVYM